MPLQRCAPIYNCVALHGACTYFNCGSQEIEAATKTSTELKAQLSAKMEEYTELEVPIVMLFLSILSTWSLLLGLIEHGDGRSR